MTDNDFFEDLDKLIAQDIPPALEPSDITVARIAERAGTDHKRATKLIAKWQKEGRVEYIGERRASRGHKVKAWRLKL